MLQITIKRQLIPLQTGKSASKQAGMGGVCNYSSICDIALGLTAYRLAFRARVD